MPLNQAGDNPGRISKGGESHVEPAALQFLVEERVALILLQLGFCLAASSSADSGNQGLLATSCHLRKRVHRAFSTQAQGSRLLPSWSRHYTGTPVVMGIIINLPGHSYKAIQAAFWYFILYSKNIRLVGVSTPEKHVLLQSLAWFSLQTSIYPFGLLSRLCYSRSLGSPITLKLAFSFFQMSDWPSSVFSQCPLSAHPIPSRFLCPSVSRPHFHMSFTQSCLQVLSTASGRNAGNKAGLSPAL